MTNQEINEAVAKCVREPMFLLVKRGLYWRPNSCRYTGDATKAGRYSREDAEARQCIRGEDDDVRMIPEPVPNYSESHDACREILDHISQNRPAMSAAFLNALRDVLGPRMPKNSVGSPIISDFDLFMATPKEICLAFLKVKGVKV